MSRILLHLSFGSTEYERSSILISKGSEVQFACLSLWVSDLIRVRDSQSLLSS